MNTVIELVDAREILDPRGDPTVEVDVVVGAGSVGRAVLAGRARRAASTAIAMLEPVASEAASRS